MHSLVPSQINPLVSSYDVLNKMNDRLSIRIRLQYSYRRRNVCFFLFRCWNTNPTPCYFWLLKGPIVLSLLVRTLGLKNIFLLDKRYVQIYPPIYLFQTKLT